MKKKPSNIVPILKYAQANEDFGDRLSALMREQSITFTKATEPLEGAVVMFRSRDGSIKVIRFGLTPELADLLIELGYAYPDDSGQATG